MLQSAASTSRYLAASTARRFALLWLVVAMLVQGFAIQTHAHAGVDRSPVIVASAHAITVAADGQQDPAVPVCPMCQEKALFGAYLLGGAVAVIAPVGAVYDYAAASLPLLAHRLSSHAWRSRAPPVFTI